MTTFLPLIITMVITISLYKLFNKYAFSKPVLSEKSGQSLITYYSIKKILQQIDNLSSISVFNSVKKYEENYIVWKSSNTELPPLHGAKSVDIFVLEEEFSHSFTNNGHCQLYDYISLNNPTVFLSQFVISEIKKQVTPEQFDNFLKWAFIQSANVVRYYDILRLKKERPEYFQLVFNSKYENYLHDLEYCGDIYEEIEPFIDHKIIKMIG